MIPVARSTCAGNMHPVGRPLMLYYDWLPLCDRTTTELDDLT